MILIAFLIILLIFVIVGIIMYVIFVSYKEEQSKVYIETRFVIPTTKIIDTIKTPGNALGKIFSQPRIFQSPTVQSPTVQSPTVQQPIVPAPKNMVPSVKSSYKKQILGVRYSTNNNDIKGIFVQLQKLINQFQNAACQYVNPSLLDTEIKKISDNIKNAPPMKCEDTDKQIDELMKMIPTEQNQLKTSIQNLWNETKPLICNSSGFIDAGLVETLLHNIYNGLCIENKGNIDDVTDGYLGYSIYVKEDSFGNYMKKLKDILYNLQKQACPLLNEGIKSIKTQMTQQINQEISNQKITCSDADKVIKEYINKEIIDKIPQGYNLNKDVLKQNMYKINEHAYNSICKNGYIDPNMVVNLYENSISSVCSI